jgi:hypothetical protein
MVEANISTFELVEFAGILITIVVSVIVINRNLKRGYKSYIDSKIQLIDNRVVSIEKEIVEDKAVNLREHDRLTELFDKIDSKLDRLIEKSK